MLDSLPIAHRVAVWTLGLASFAGLGALLGSAMPTPLVWTSGAASGLVLGVLAVWVFLHAIGGEPARLGVQRLAAPRR